MRQTSYTEKHIPTLDGWRGLAVLWVLALHVRLSLLRQGLSDEDAPFARFAWYGETGVEMFFALSGILITFILCREIADTGTLSLRRFYLRRAFRLLPASLVYLAFLAVLHGTGIIDADWEGIAAAILLCRNYVASDDWYSGHFWSLSVEEHFYLFWPFFLLAVRRHRVPLLIGAAILLAALYRELVFSVEIVDLSISGVKKHYRTDFLLVFLLCGGLFGFLFFEDRSRELLRRLVTPTVANLLILGLVAGVWVDFHGIYLAKALLFPAIMTSTALHPRSALARALQWKPLAGLGVISYGVYVWQQVWLSFDVEPTLIGVLQVFPANLVLAIVSGYLSYRIIETPIRRKGYALVRGRLAPRD